MVLKGVRLWRGVQMEMYQGVVPCSQVSQEGWPCVLGVVDERGPAAGLGSAFMSPAEITGPIRVISINLSSPKQVARNLMSPWSCHYKQISWACRYTENIDRELSIVIPLPVVSREPLNLVDILEGVPNYSYTTMPSSVSRDTMAWNLLVRCWNPSH